MEKYLTAREVLKILGISRPTLNKFVKEGRLKAYKPSPQILRFLEKDILEFMQSGSPLFRK
jgi:excisionase family DNA binding protein